MEGDAAAASKQVSNMQTWSPPWSSQQQQQQQLQAEGFQAGQRLPMPHSCPGWSTPGSRAQASTSAPGAAAEVTATGSPTRRRKRWLDLPSGAGHGCWPGAEGAVAAVQAPALPAQRAAMAEVGSGCQQAQQGLRPAPRVRHRATITTTGPPGGSKSRGTPGGDSSAFSRSGVAGCAGPASSASAQNPSRGVLNCAAQEGAAVQPAVMGLQEAPAVSGLPMVGHWPAARCRPAPRPLPVLDMAGVSSSSGGGTSSSCRKQVEMGHLQQPLDPLVAAAVEMSSGRPDGPFSAAEVPQVQRLGATATSRMQHADGATAAAADSNGSLTRHAEHPNLASAVLLTTEHAEERKLCSRSQGLHCRPAPKVPSFLLGTLQRQQTAIV
jgi:hypothetical protein